MTAPRHAGLAAKFLRESVKLDGPPPAADARDAAILAIERAIAARSRRKRARVVLGVVGGVAAAAAIALGMLKFIPALRGDEGVAATGVGSSVPMLAHPVAGSANATNAAGALVIGAEESDLSKAVPLRDGARVSQGQRVIAPADGKIVFAHVTGSELTLNGGADMSIVEDDDSRIYALGKGKLDLRVAKLRATERLVVRTKDAEVEVRGTRFHVEVLDAATSCDGRSTRVSVDEGVVVVRRDGVEVRLTAGQSWPACTQSATEPQTPTSQQHASEEPPQAPATGAQNSLLNGQSPPQTQPQTQPQMTGPSYGDKTRPSALEEQNDLFAEGIEKKHRGDIAGAVASFERLLTKYPKGVLAENASAERLKALRASNPDRAKGAARDYLGRWPHGFARDEAESVLREAP